MLFLLDFASNSINLSNKIGSTFSESLYDAINIIKEASKICNFVGADVVELAPVKTLHSCDFLTAKLCYKILSFALAKPKK